jgi:hypothetical protein
MLIIYMILICLLIVPFQAQGKMSFLLPKEMITNSDLIVIGIVTQRTYTENHRKVIISVETFIKGENNQNEIVIERDKDPHYNWHNSHFPEEGTKVMVFFQRNRDENELYLTSDGFSIVVIKHDGKEIELFNGVNKGSKLYKLYQEEFLIFLKDNYKR